MPCGGGACPHREWGGAATTGCHHLWRGQTAFLTPAPSRALRPRGAGSRSLGAVGVLCVALGCSRCLVEPVRRRPSPMTGHTGSGRWEPRPGCGWSVPQGSCGGRRPVDWIPPPGAKGSPVQGVYCRACGEAAAPKSGAHLPGGGRSILHGPWGGSIVQEPGTPARRGLRVQLRGWSEYLPWPMAGHHCPGIGQNVLGGTGSPAQGSVRVSFRGHGVVALSKNRGHRPCGDEIPTRGGPDCPSGPMGRRHCRSTRHTGYGAYGDSSPGDGRNILQDPWGGAIVLDPAHRPWGDRESSPGGGRSIFQGPWGGSIVQEPDKAAWGGRGFQPRGWLKYPSRAHGEAASF